MKAARLVILGVALLAGGAAAFLVSREEPKPVVAKPTNRPGWKRSMS